jgi:nucleoside-diphosphate-sugar epimerase
MGKALIGYTGFVGSNLARQVAFDELFNSSNVQEMDGKRFDMVVCAGARAEKWRANREPELDRADIEKLISHLERISTHSFILISTVDVYANPSGVYEDSPITTENLSTYGKNRYLLEETCFSLFPQTVIIRLPGLFGTGLKKNFIFDILHNPSALSLTHSESQFQFYGLDHIWSDIETVIANGLKIINFATPPLSARHIAQVCGDNTFDNKTPNLPVLYDMRTRFSEIFQSQGDYIWTLEKELSELHSFADSQRDPTS